MENKMKPKEAWESVRSNYIQLAKEKYPTFPKVIAKKEAKCKIIDNLIAKAEPMVPLDNDIDIVDDDINIGVCKCGMQVDSTMRYCSHCGQALDWSDEK